jgi:tetratricopeptide (TPR) repeat protein
MPEPAFNPEDVHKFYSAGCFNQAWDLIDKPQRSAEENESMIQLAHAALWHWSQRPDCSDKNLSIGYWQLSRIHALLGDGPTAGKYAKICLEKTPKDDAFLLGYAFEALARAELTQGNPDKAKEHHAEASRLSKGIQEAESKQLLLSDLESLF